MWLCCFPVESLRWSPLVSLPARCLLGHSGHFHLVLASSFSGFCFFFFKHFPVFISTVFFFSGCFILYDPITLFVFLYGISLLIESDISNLWPSP